jgi:hypothetical protein
VVVLAETGYPGEGYFTLAREMGLHHGKKEFEDLDFFVEELEKVYACWKK